MNQQNEQVVQNIQNNQDYKTESTLECNQDHCDEKISERKNEIHNEEQTLKIFSHLVKFINNLNDVFGKKQHSLQLYNRLITATKLTFNSGISRHIEIFRNFVEKNKQAIKEKNIEKLNEPIIFYSKNVNIKMKEIFRMSDLETQLEIWKHLIVISTLINPSIENRIVLKDNIKKSNFKCQTREDRVLQETADFIKDNINLDDIQSNPASTIASLVSSGVIANVFSKITNELSDKEFNMGNLIQSMQKMCNSENELDNTQINNVFSVLNSFNSDEKKNDIVVVEPNDIVVVEPTNIVVVEPTNIVVVEPTDVLVKQPTKSSN